MIIDTWFTMNKTCPVTFYVTESTEVAGQPTEPAEVAILSAKCILTKGSASMRYVSDKMKPDVTATIILRPRDYTKPIPEGATAVVTTLRGEEIFCVMLADNVGEQNAAVVVPCKRF